MLGGGGDRGAYEAGAVKGLVEALAETGGAKFDIISGVSTGAINSWLMAQHSIGNEADAVEDMVKFWTSISKSDIYEIWKIGRGLCMCKNVLAPSQCIVHKQYIT